ARSQPPGRLHQGGEGLQAPDQPEAPATRTLDTLTQAARAEGIAVGRNVALRSLVQSQASTTTQSSATRSSPTTPSSTSYSAGRSRSDYGCSADMARPWWAAATAGPSAPRSASNPANARRPSRDAGRGPRPGTGASHWSTATSDSL